MRYLKIALLLLFIIVGGYAALLFRDAFVGKSGEPISFVIEEGATPAEVALHLEREGVIGNAQNYLLYGSFDKSVYRAKAGRYEIETGASFRSLARQFAIGPERSEVVIRLIEGRTVDQAIEQLAEEHGIPTEETAAMTGRSKNASPFDPRLREEFAFLAALPEDRSLEGYLFPDTYHVWEDELPEGLIYKQLNEFNRRYGSATISSAASPLKNLDEVIILASIVEKEVPAAADRAIVAGVFLNRLKSGMRLQSDATINYLTGSGRARSTSADLEIDSPYNSYRNAGLPPSPIGNPGAKSIDAVLAPQDTDFFFFLTTDEGEVLYARTFDEHIQNRVRAGF